MRIGISGGLRAIPSVALALTFCVGLLVPIYTDEVAWRFQLSRLLQDGWLDRGLGESCGPGTSVAPPLFMWPVRLFSSAATAAFPSPLAVRLAGMACALAMLTLLTAVTARLARLSGGLNAIRILPGALLGLGVLPFLLVWSRPEQPVLLALLGAILIGLAEPASGRAATGRLAAIVALAAIALSYQFKAIFYLPLFAWSIVRAGRGARSWTGRAIALALVLGMAGLAWRYWTARFACPDDPLVAARIAHENAGAVLIHARWGERLAAVPSLLRDMNPLRYVKPISPAGPFMSGWLPALDLPRRVLKLWKTAVIAGWLAGIALGIVALGAACANRGHRREQAPVIVLALLCLACPSAWALLQRNVNVYEAALYLPVLALGIAAALAAAEPSRRHAQTLGIVSAVVAALSLTSQAALAASFAPELWRAERAGGYLAGQPYSLSAFNYPATRRRIVAVGKMCGIPDRPAPDRLLIDDLTYFAYSAGARPMHRLGVVSGWNGSIRDPLVWMRDHRSSGAVIACAYLPPALRAEARASGDLCCIPRP